LVEGCVFISAIPSWCHGLHRCDRFRYSPNNLIYWEAIRAACEKGYRQFDFGRHHTAAEHINSRDSGELLNNPCAGNIGLARDLPRSSSRTTLDITPWRVSGRKYRFLLPTSSALPSAGT
jgi:hypothetical protein